MIWPEGKRFAFTVFDDTDYATIRNVGPIYSLLEELGMKTTKSVWLFRGTYVPKIGGSTCEEHEYREWIMSLKQKGFEIGFHGATFHSSTRERSKAGLEKFKDYFGAPPAVYANHSKNAEDIYWGAHRFTGINKVFYHILTHGGRFRKYDGHLENSPRFWGDLCKEQVRYVRDFVFSDINTLKQCPYMPYHDPHRPYVNYWFASSEGGNVSLYKKRISEADQDRLEAEGGACIMYTHFADGFVQHDRIDPQFKTLMERLSKKNGWFVPVHVLLDYLLQVNGAKEISLQERKNIERKFLIDRVKLRFPTLSRNGNGHDSQF